MMTCIAIDDEPLALELINAFCKDSSFVELKKTFVSVGMAEKYLKENIVDLLLLDIQMPGISGIDFYRNQAIKPMVIFTTAYREYAVEGFELNAIDYLLKPFTYERFMKSLEKAREYQRFSKEEEGDVKYIMVRSEYSLVKILLQDILFIETMDDYVKIHLLGKKPVITLMSMKAMMEKLPANEFMRIHRSFCVPLSKVEAVRGKMVYLYNKEIPISSTYEKDFLKQYGKTIY
ncbi:MAG: LytTR family DNA-binding domain-containing protein [Chitinophagales bacterium]|nr:LytTR family DNA-binding domain-containing protein [Chitinophagales bacterium]